MRKKNSLIEKTGVPKMGLYSKEVREQLVEEELISNEEDGFMMGYEEDIFDLKV